MLSRERMIDRMNARDGTFDGRFITGVLSTGIYCLPSCKARNPKPENVRFFPSEAAARAAGLRPCKRCRPDDFYRHRDPDLERLEAAVMALRRDPGQFPVVAALAGAAEVGSSKLHALVRHHYHTTPARLLTRARVAAAARRLQEGDGAITAIGFDVGYESLSSFHANFRRRMGLSPRAYRALRGADTVAIHLPSTYPRQRTLAHLGRDPESLTQRVRGAEALLGVRLAGVPATLRIALEKGRARATITARKPLGEGAAAEAHGQLLRILGLHASPTAFERRATADPALAPLVARRRGLRIPQLPRPFDALVWTVLGQQINLAFAFTLHRRLVERVGVPVGEGLYAPPTPEAIAALSVEALHGVQYSRRKAEYLVELSRRVAAGLLPLDALTAAPATRVEAALLAERGVGPWSANYLLMRGYGFEDCVPLGDTGLTAGLVRLFQLPEKPEREAVVALMERFAPYRSHATFYLWQSLEDPS
jgi:AraC family transcriptional regulator of adaptative response / DNA-3-methyladenine glycosylase II